MDLTYDYIRDEPNRKDENESNNGANNDQPQTTLNSEIQDAYKAFSASPWGARLGGFFGNVVKQVWYLYRAEHRENR